MLVLLVESVNKTEWKSILDNLYIMKIFLEAFGRIDCPSTCNSFKCMHIYHKYMYYKYCKYYTCIYTRIHNLPTAVAGHYFHILIDK